MSSRRRATEVSWDSDDDLLKDQPSVSAFPSENSTEDDLDVDDIDINALLGYDEDDLDGNTKPPRKTAPQQEKTTKQISAGSQKTTTSTKNSVKPKTATVKETASSKNANSAIKEKKQIREEKISIKEGNSDSCTKNVASRENKPIKKEKVVFKETKVIPSKQAISKKTTSVQSKSSTTVSSNKVEGKPKGKIQPIVFDLPAVEQPEEEVLLLDPEEDLDFGSEDTHSQNDSSVEGTAIQSSQGYSSQDEPMTNFVVTATTEEFPDRDVSLQESTFHEDDEEEVNNESSEDSDSEGEDGRRGRFKSERKKISIVKTVKKERGLIPDTLEISQEQQAELDEFYQQGRGGRIQGRGRGRGGIAGRLGPRPGTRPNNASQNAPHQVSMATGQSRPQQPFHQTTQPVPLMETGPFPHLQTAPQQRDIRPRTIHINPRFRPPGQSIVPPAPHQMLGQPRIVPHSAPSVPNPQPLLQQSVRPPAPIVQPIQQVERWATPVSSPPQPLFSVQTRPPHHQAPYPVTSQPYPVTSQPYHGPGYPQASMPAIPRQDPAHLHHPPHNMHPGQAMPGPGQNIHGPPGPQQHGQFYPGGQRGPPPLLQDPHHPPPHPHHPGHQRFEGRPQHPFIPQQNNQFGHRPPHPQHFQPVHSAPPQHHQPPPLMSQHPGGGQYRGQIQPQSQPQRFQQPHVQNQGPQFRQQGPYNQSQGPGMQHQQPPRPQLQQPRQQPRPGMQQRPRQELSDAQKSARLAHAKKLQERARKFQINKLQQNQGPTQGSNQGSRQGQQVIPVIGGRPQKRPSSGDTDGHSPAKQPKEEPKPLPTGTIEVDPEMKKKLEEQAALREKIRRQKEANRQMAAEKRKKELEERLAKEGKTLADVEASTTVAQQPKTGQLQPGPVRNTIQGQENVRGPSQGQGQTLTHQQRVFHNMQQNSVSPNRPFVNEPKKILTSQKGIKRTSANHNEGQGQIQPQGSIPSLKEGQSGSKGHKLMKRVTVIKKNSLGEIISKETKMVPIENDQDQNATKGPQVSTSSAGPSSNKISLTSVGGNRVVAPSQAPQQNRSVVLKGQGQNHRKVISHQAGEDQHGRRVVMSGDMVNKKVLIKNLSSSTTESQVHRLCSVVGPVETLQLNKVTRQAVVTFLNSKHAEMFQQKYNRHMVDLSHITVDLLTN